MNRVMLRCAAILRSHTTHNKKYKPTEKEKDRESAKNVQQDHSIFFPTILACSNAPFSKSILLTVPSYDVEISLFSSRGSNVRRATEPVCGLNWKTPSSLSLSSSPTVHSPTLPTYSTVVQHRASKSGSTSFRAHQNKYEEKQPPHGVHACAHTYTHLSTVVRCILLIVQQKDQSTVVVELY